MCARRRSEWRARRRSEGWRARRRSALLLQGHNTPVRNDPLWGAAVRCAFSHGWTAARQGHTIVEFAAAVQCSFQRRTGCLLSRKYPCRVRGGGLFFLLQRSLRLREVGKGRKSADVGRRQSVEPLSRDGFSVAGGRLPRFSVLYFVLPPPHSAGCCVSRCPDRFGVVLYLFCVPPTSSLRAGSGGKPSNVTKKQNIPQRGLQITGFLLYYPKKQIFNSAQRCRQGWNFGEVQLRL